MHAKIKQKIRFSIQGQSVQLDDIEVLHLLPNEFARNIGPFVFIEHFLSHKQTPGDWQKEFVDNRSNPCRGIATLTYILAGEVEHWDSIRNHVKLGSGGVHWTNAGKGIVHHEAITPELRMNHPEASVVRFWVNLPSKHKSGVPGYYSLQSNDIPQKELDGIAGWIRILSGEYAHVMAKIPCCSKEFLY